MNNLFENAKFGDKFVTRDGRNALYLSKDEYSMLFAVEGCNCIVGCDHDGIMMYPCDSGYDIISRYVEPIDEEELDRLAQEAYPSDYSSSLYYDPETDANIELREAFEKGYRKAKRNKHVQI